MKKKKNLSHQKKKPFYLFYPFFILQKTTLKFFIFLFFTLNPDHACLRVTKNELKNDYVCLRERLSERKRIKIRGKKNE